MSSMVSFSNVNQVVILVSAMLLRFISSWSKFVSWIRTIVSSTSESRDPPVRLYWCTGLVTVDISCKLRPVNISVDTSTVSVKTRVSIPSFMSRSKLSSLGLTSSSMNMATGSASSLGTSTTRLPFMSATRFDVKLKKVVDLFRNNCSSCLIKLRSSVSMFIMSWSPLVLLDSPPVRVKNVLSEIFPADCKVNAVKSRVLRSTGSSNSRIMVPLLRSTEKTLSMGGVMSS